MHRAYPPIKTRPSYSHTAYAAAAQLNITPQAVRFLIEQCAAAATKVLRSALWNVRSNERQAARCMQTKTSTRRAAAQQRTMMWRRR